MARAYELVAVVMDQVVGGLGDPYLRLPRDIPHMPRIFLEIREGGHIAPVAKGALSLAINRAIAGGVKNCPWALR